MTLIVIGLLLALVGAFMTAAEFRACEYERSNIGPPLALIGVALMVLAIGTASF